MSDPNKELGEAIRDASLAQIAEGLVRLGVPKDKIEAAKLEAIKQDSDQPMLELARAQFSR